MPLSVATQVGHLPPVATLFAAFLGYNPCSICWASGVLATLPAHNVAVAYRPPLLPAPIAGPFHHGLVIVFTAAAAMALVAALVSLLRGRQFYYEDGPVPAGPAEPVPARSPHRISCLTETPPRTALPRVTRPGRPVLAGWTEPAGHPPRKPSACTVESTASGASICGRCPAPGSTRKVAPGMAAANSWP